MLKGCRILSVFLFIGSLASGGAALADSNPQCRRELASDPKLYSNHFHWNYELDDMIKVFAITYHVEERLPKRLFYDQNQAKYILPYGDSEKNFVKLSSKFIENIILQVQKAFSNHLVDALMFPDMGHSHILIPQKTWQQVYSKFSVKDTNKLYEKLFSDPQIRILYHTAEQLKMRSENGELLPDERVQKRYRERNLVFKNDASASVELLQNPSSPANTVSEVAGYFWWGAGFNISANKSGCLRANVEGKDLGFDLSLYDLEPDPNSEGTSD